jgi:hypothetical protein
MSHVTYCSRERATSDRRTPYWLWDRSSHSVSSWREYWLPAGREHSSPAPAGDIPLHDATPATSCHGMNHTHYDDPILLIVLLQFSQQCFRAEPFESFGSSGRFVVSIVAQFCMRCGRGLTDNWGLVPHGLLSEIQPDAKLGVGRSITTHHIHHLSMEG